LIEGATPEELKLHSSQPDIMDHYQGTNCDWLEKRWPPEFDNHDTPEDTLFVTDEDRGPLASADLPVFEKECDLDEADDIDGVSIFFSQCNASTIRGLASQVKQFCKGKTIGDLEGLADPVSQRRAAWLHETYQHRIQTRSNQPEGYWPRFWPVIRGGVGTSHDHATKIMAPQRHYNYTLTGLELYHTLKQEVRFSLWRC
jgi:hypothetical protein